MSRCILVTGGSSGIGLTAVRRRRGPKAADPDEVGAAIEACIEGEHPPVRIVVGADARQLLATAADPNVFVPGYGQFVADVG